MTCKRAKAGAGLRVNVYAVISRAIEEGVNLGLRRAWKHVDAPEGWTEETHVRVADVVADSALDSICEVFDFSSVDDGPQ